MNIYRNLSIPDITQAKRVLCVQPHYDDNDIGAGGTIAALHDQGAEIIYLTVTDDLLGVLDPELSDEQATKKLRQDQQAAGALIGVEQQIWLGYPDAGDTNYIELRRSIIGHMRALKPDLLLTCDPWLLYEAHRDHIMTGMAVAEASILYNLPRLKTDPEIDRQFQPYAIQGIGFYYTSAGNAVIDIDKTRNRKHAALDCYQTQLNAETLEGIHWQLELEERGCAESTPFMFGEPLKILRTDQLHISVHTFRS